MMAESKHTPGPWKAIRSLDRRDGEYDYAISAAGAPVLAEAFGRSTTGGILPAADNGRLIAAAPDLLAVAKRIEAAMDFDASDHPMFDGLQKQLLAAIAKAEAA